MNAATTAAPDRAAARSEVIREVYEAHVDRIFRFAYFKLGNREDAEDVTSQVFMKAYEAYGRYEARQEAPTAWIFRIARNAALDHYRRAGRKERLERAVAREPVRSADPGTMAEERILYRALLDFLARMPARQREVIGLRHSGLSFLEVGTLMECSEDAAKMLYHRAVKALRASLPDEVK